MRTATRDKLIVAAAFAVIFGFSSVDSAISPLVAELHQSFGVSMPEILQLISWCTAGIVAGVLVGPALAESIRVSRLLLISISTMLLALLGFLLAGDIQLALLFRLVFGLSSGLIASCMWWLTFHGVSREYYQAMVAVLLSARPLATALGVPAAALLATHTGWRPAFGTFWLILALFGLILVLALFSIPEPAKKRFRITNLVTAYRTAFSKPYVLAYYGGLTINRMCYFGFYAIAGIWFIRHYQLSALRISSALLIIGLGEAFINFLVPAVLRRLGHSVVFLGTLIASGVIFPVFISGQLPLGATLVLITLFMLLDRF